MIVTRNSTFFRSGNAVVKALTMSPDCWSESAAAKELIMKIKIIIKTDGYQILKNLPRAFNSMN